MTYNPNELHCTFCGAPLESYEIEYIQRGTAVRCSRCGSVLTNQSYQDVGRDSTIPSAGYPQPIQQSYQPARKRGSGALVFFLGFVVLSLGLYSWIFPIPIFSSTFYGEVLGAIATIFGLSNLRKDASNPFGINVMILGVIVWFVAWMSWITYIPILSDVFFGEAAGLIIIIYGYLISNR